jgi:hypothetical protein
MRSSAGKPRIAKGRKVMFKRYLLNRNRGKGGFFEIRQERGDKEKLEGNTCINYDGTWELGKSDINPTQSNDTILSLEISSLFFFFIKL